MVNDCLDLVKGNGPWCTVLGTSVCDLRTNRHVSPLPRLSYTREECGKSVEAHVFFLLQEHNTSIVSRLKTRPHARGHRLQKLIY